MIRQVKGGGGGGGKARQLNKDYNKSAEKNMTVVAKADMKQQYHHGGGHQRNQTQMLNKSIQDGKVNLPKPNANQPHVRKASMGIISPTQNSSSLFNDNKLIFSGSQLTTVKVDKSGGGGKPPTVKDKLNTTQPIKQQVTKLHITK